MGLSFIISSITLSVQGHVSSTCVSCMREVSTITTFGGGPGTDRLRREGEESQTRYDTHCLVAFLSYPRLRGKGNGRPAGARNTKSDT